MTANDIKPKCHNTEHPNTEMKRVDGIFALTNVQKHLESVTFLPASGIPVIAFICPKCGEMRLFPAKAFGEI